MSNLQERRYFHNLRDFVQDDVSFNEPRYFHFCAALRIHGDDIPFDEISRRLRVEATTSRRAGERRRPDSQPYRDDAWHYKSSLAETEPLEAHLDELWSVIEPCADYLKSLKERFRVDVFCGYRSNCDMAGFEMSHRALKLFVALEIPFGVSIIVIPDQVIA